MTFHPRARRSICRSGYCLASLIVLCIGQPAAGIGLVYVEGDDGFTSGNPNLSPSAGGALADALDSLQSIRDNKWGYRALGSFGTAFESGTTANPGDEDAPELRFNIDSADGLVSGGSYDLYVAYWSANGQNWAIRGGLTSGNTTLFNRTGPLAFLPSAVAGTPATAALWTTPPPLLTEADRTMFLGKVGTATASGGQINVFIDDLPTSGFPDSTAGNAFNFRSWLDGVAFIEAGSAISLSATVNRTTGQILLSNSTGQNVQVVSYSINSTAGALNPNNWLSISGNYDGNDGSEFDAHPWNITAPTMPFPAAATTLSEAEDASGGNSGGALTPTPLNLGNAWIRTPIEDLQISVTLSNATVLTFPPTYTGTAIMPGDIDADGDIDVVDDFRILALNMHTNVASLTQAQAYRLGDLTGNLAIDHADFAAFRAAFNAAHGAGAFETAIGAPEPASIALIIFSLAIGLRRRRDFDLPRRPLRCAPAAVQPSRDTSANATRHLQWHPTHHRGGIMVRYGNRLRGMLIWAFACGLLALGADSACGQITYVDATPSNTTLAAGGAITTSPDASGTDGIWRLRALSNGATVYESGGDISATGSAVDGNNENAPRWVTKISGLTPNETYSAFAYFWSAAGAQNWQLQASLTNPNGDLPVFARLTPTPAAVATNFAAPAPIVTEADRVMYQAALGVGRSNASGELSVYVDDNPSPRQGIANAWNFRNWYDGVGFTEATVLTLRVNTTNGAVTILNSESTSFDINYYEIRSAAGALHLAGWNSLDEQEGIDPVGTGWDETGGSGPNILSELNLLGMRSLAPTNTVNLGNAFSVGGTQDLTFSYGLLDGTLQPGFVEYFAGPAGVAGDYNENGIVDAGDYVVWRNSLGTGSLPNEGGISPGTVDQADYNFWKSRFGMTSGSGSVAATATIPEPEAAVLFATIAVVLAAIRRIPIERSR